MSKPLPAGLPRSIGREGNGALLPELLDNNNTASNVWADMAYRSKKNETHLTKNGVVSQVDRKRPVTALVGLV